MPDQDLTEGVHDMSGKKQTVKLILSLALAAGLFAAVALGAGFYEAGTPYGSYPKDPVFNSVTITGSTGFPYFSAGVLGYDNLAVHLGRLGSGTPDNTMALFWPGVWAAPAAGSSLIGGSNPTLNTLGQVGVDNTAGQLLYFDNAVHVLVPDDSKGATILAPTGTDNATLYYTTRPITINGLYSVLTGSDNVTWFIRHATTRNAASPDNVVSAGTTTTSAGSGTMVYSFDDPTIPAGRWVWLQVTALGGSPQSIHVTMSFTYDRE